MRLRWRSLDRPGDLKAVLIVLVMWLTAILVLSATGCTDILSPMPGHPERMDPLPDYPRWFSQVEKCAGRYADFQQIRWYMYRGQLKIPGSRAAPGWEWSRDHKIAIVEWAIRDSVVVGHEMLHDILGRDDHPAGYGAKCAGLIVDWP